MRRLSFYKLLPGGNSTIILVNTGLPPDGLPAVAGALMHPLHLQAEQVAELFCVGALPHLQMMGGEFCVNATRAAALLLAGKNALRPLKDCLHGMLTVSGMTSPVHVLVGREEETSAALLRAIASGELPLPEEPEDLIPATANASKAFDGEAGASPTATQLFCAARMICGAAGAKLSAIAPGVNLVHMPGISHLLLDADIHPMPADWRRASLKWRKQTGLDTAPASGVVWYEREEDTYRIWPAVEVRATHSEHLETACGSASMSMALLHQEISDSAVDTPALPLPRSTAALVAAEKNRPLTIIQPSGESLTVTLQYAPEHSSGLERQLPAYAWVSGKVTLVAEGVAHV